MNTEFCSDCACHLQQTCLAGVHALLGDGYCHDELNNLDCDYDGGDCCLSSLNTEHCSDCACHLQQMCLAGVHPFVGDGYCHDELNNAECSYDGDDCCLSPVNTKHCSDCSCHLKCPVSNPNYAVISGTCYYIENTTPMNYADAQLNCQYKLGGLFEPRLVDTNQLVYTKAANFISTISDDFWLGMNDLANQGQYVYASDGQAVVDGMWFSGQPNNENERCVAYAGSWGVFDYVSNAGWSDRPCDFLSFFICEVDHSGKKEILDYSQVNSKQKKYSLNF